MTRDDRTTYLNFFGQEYPLCLTVLASDSITKEFGGYDALGTALSKGVDSLGDWAKLLQILMDGGAARVKAIAWLNGENPDNPDVPDLDTIRNILSWGDIQRDRDLIMSAISGSSNPTVEAEPDMGKNAEATQESE